MRCFMAFAVAVCLTHSAWAQPTTSDPYYWRINRNGGGISTVEALDIDSGIIAASVVYPPPPASSGYDGIMVKSGNGTAWVADVISGDLRSFTIAGAGPIVNVFGMTHAAPSLNQGPWTLESSPFGTQVSLRDGVGNALFSVSIGLNNPQFLLPTLGGNVWVVDGLPVVGQSTVLQPVSATGVAGLRIPIMGAPLVDAISDRQGRVWILSVNAVSVIDPLGNLLQSVPAPAGARYMLIDPRGRPRVYSVNGPDLSVDVYDPVSLTRIGGATAPGVGVVTDVEVDSRGRWLVRDDMGATLVYAPDGLWLYTLPATVPTVPPLLNRKAYGTGVSLAGLLAFTSDIDGDGVISESEIRSGSDPLNPNSIPPQVTLTPALTAGLTSALAISAPEQPGGASITGVAQGPGPLELSALFPVSLDLAFDPLLQFWISPANSLQAPSGATALDAAGDGSVFITVPAGISGANIRLAVLTVNALGRLGASSEAQALVIQ